MKEIYELRIYEVKPNEMDRLLKAWKLNYKKISKYFNCIGIWVPQSGNINSVYHLYKWKSYEEMEKNKNLFKINMIKYIQLVKKMYVIQTSIILKDTEIRK
jgi:NADH:ubiquinone oxidoreductase subunit C